MHPEAEQAKDDNDVAKKASVDARDADRTQHMAEQEAVEQVEHKVEEAAEEAAEVTIQETMAESIEQPTQVTAPDYALEVVEEDGAPVRVVVRIQLPLVASAGDIDAGVVDAQVLELEVPGVYSLRTKLPVPIDEDKVSCRFDKKKKI